MVQCSIWFCTKYWKYYEIYLHEFSFFYFFYEKINYVDKKWESVFFICSSGLKDGFFEASYAFFYRAFSFNNLILKGVSLFKGKRIIILHFNLIIGGHRLTMWKTYIQNIIKRGVEIVTFDYNSFEGVKEIIRSHQWVKD